MRCAAVVIVLLAGTALGQDGATPDAPQTDAPVPQEVDAPPNAPEPGEPVSKVPR